MGTMLRYIGPFESVEVPEAGIVAERLKPYEIDTDLAKNLLSQEDNWERPPKPKPRAKAEEPAPTEAPEDETPATTERASTSDGV